MIEDKFLKINNIKIISFLKKFDLPIYIYNYKKIIFNLYKIKKLKFYVFFSIKSNNNVFLLKIILNTVKKFDIVSINELKTLLLINKFKPYIIFSSCGKSLSELIIAVNFQIFCINIESLQELFKLYFICLKKKNISLMIRINPNIDAKTNKKITTGTKLDKFGILLKNLLQCILFCNLSKLPIIGYDFHLGSQITSLIPIKKLFKFIKKLIFYIPQKNIDIGGGLGIDYYESKSIIKFNNYYKYVLKLKNYYKLNIKIIIELGRFFFGNCCIILCKSNYLKYNNYNKISILNTSMNDNIRPSMYNSYHKIESNNFGKKIKNFFGSICESSDKLINKKQIRILNNSLIIMFSCGSYCKVMSNNYNSKLKIFDLIIYKNKLKIIFKKEKINYLIKNNV